jgi:hypothetical protein
MMQEYIIHSKYAVVSTRTTTYLLPLIQLLNQSKGKTKMTYTNTTLRLQFGSQVLNNWMPKLQALRSPLSL